MKINYGWLKAGTGYGSGWIRAFGYGFGWKNLRRLPLSFSERNGYTPHFEIGRWSFSWLKQTRT